MNKPCTWRFLTFDTFYRFFPLCLFLTEGKSQHIFQFRDVPGVPSATYLLAAQAAVPNNDVRDIFIILVNIFGGVTFDGMRQR